MRGTRVVLMVAMACVIGAGLSAAQDLPAKNPLEGDANAIRAGMGLFRGRCADCHGMDAHGVRGPDITQVWASGRTDVGLFMVVPPQVVVPGSCGRVGQGVGVRVRLGGHRGDAELDVDRDHAGRAGENRVEVEFGDLGKVLGQPAEPEH